MFCFPLGITSSASFSWASSQSLTLESSGSAMSFPSAASLSSQSCSWSRKSTREGQWMTKRKKMEMNMEEVPMWLKMKSRREVFWCNIFFFMNTNSHWSKNSFCINLVPSVCEWIHNKDWGNEICMFQAYLLSVFSKYKYNQINLTLRISNVHCIGLLLFYTFACMVLTNNC